MGDPQGEAGDVAKKATESTEGSEDVKKGRVDQKVVAAAEREMRRPAPQISSQPKKRRRQNSVGGEEVNERGGLPRYDYTALDDMGDGFKGFLVLCVQEKQKSALSEFMNLIKDYLPLEVSSKPKHTRFVSDDEGSDEGKGVCKPEDKGLETAGRSTSSIDGGQPEMKAEEEEEKQVVLRPIRVSCLGVLFLKLENWEVLPTSKQPTSIVRKIISDLEDSERLMYCQRIIPVEHVCPLDEKSMKDAAPVAIREFQKQCKGDAPKKYDTFAVSFKGRGKLTSSERAQAIKTLAAGVEESMREKGIKVDLKNPTVALMCEVVPALKKQVACICLVDKSLLSVGSAIRLKPTGIHGKK